MDKKITPWLWLVIAVMWLLPLVGVSTGSWGPWVATLALLGVAGLALTGKE